MELQLIALPSAHALEALRQKGLSDEDIFTHITTNNINIWEEEGLYFDELLEIASKDTNVLNEILSNGYKVKFMTIRGLQTLLKTKWDFEPARDFEVTEKGISGLQLDSQKLETLKQMLAKNCTLHEEATNVIGITLA